jgi:hypothetical protein
MMARAPKPPALQVLFEPWPDEAGADRDGYEAFAGHYLLDALEPSGEFKVRGFRAVVAGCTTCRRDAKDARVHVPNINDLKPEGPRRRCPQWKRVEAIVKAFGGWKAVHYVELAMNEGLGYQPIPQRRREVVKCPACDGTGLGPMDHEALSAWYETRSKADEARIHPPCDAGCGSYGYRSKGELLVSYEGPVRPDRHAMTAAQRRTR